MWGCGFRGSASWGARSLLYVFGSWWVRLAFSKLRHEGGVVIPLHSWYPSSVLDLSTMPSSRAFSRESCLMTFPKHDNFLYFIVSNIDLLVPLVRITSSFVIRLVQLIRSMRLSVHISNASRLCCDILLMVHYVYNEVKVNKEQLWLLRNNCDAIICFNAHCMPLLIPWRFMKSPLEKIQPEYFF